MLQLLQERRLERLYEIQLSINGFVEMLFPKATKKKQHEYALRFLVELSSKEEMTNGEARNLFESASDKRHSPHKKLPGITGLLFAISVNKVYKLVLLNACEELITIHPENMGER
jgi:hypothetical protein